MSPPGAKFITAHLHSTASLEMLVKLCSLLSSPSHVCNGFSQAFYLLHGTMDQELHARIPSIRVTNSVRCSAHQHGKNVVA